MSGIITVDAIDLSWALRWSYSAATLRQHAPWVLLRARDGHLYIATAGRDTALQYRIPYSGDSDLHVAVRSGDLADTLDMLAMADRATLTVTPHGRLAIDAEGASCDIPAAPPQGGYASAIYDALALPQHMPAEPQEVAAVTTQYLQQIPAPLRHDDMATLWVCDGRLIVVDRDDRWLYVAGLVDTSSDTPEGIWADTLDAWAGHTPASETGGAA